MTNSKTTKRALLASALSIFLCVAMLIGTTFAWFTDTASTSVNTITSGKLEVQILDEDEKPVNELQWLDPDGKPIANQEGILWEPGCTYKLAPFRIVNTGNLALKYKIVVIGLDGDAELLDVIHFTYKIGDATLDLEKEGHLAAMGKDGDRTELINISAHMDEDAGNKYQEKELAGVKFTVYATQDTVEYDSNDNQYDKFASYAPSGEVHEVTDFDDGAKNAFAAGGTIVLKGYTEVDATRTEVKDRLVIKSPSIVDFQATIHVPGSLEATANWAALFINADTTINASSGGGIACLDKIKPDGKYIGGPYVAHIAGDGIVVTVNGGFYHGGGTTFNVQKGTLIVNGGTFQVTPDVDTGDYRYTLNCIDANYKNGTANIIVKGGTFVNFDPSNNLAEGEGTNFVAEGYKVVPETQKNGDIWYTVVPE